MLFSDLVYSFGVLDRCFLNSVFMDCFDVDFCFVIWRLRFDVDLICDLVLVN